MFISYSIRDLLANQGGHRLGYGKIDDLPKTVIRDLALAGNRTPVVELKSIRPDQNFHSFTSSSPNCSKIFQVHERSDCSFIHSFIRSLLIHSFIH